MGRESWWDWRAGLSRDVEQFSLTENQQRTALESLAERCVILDNLVFNVTHPTIRSALGQFGTVLGVKLVLNPANVKFVGAAIVEMSTKEQRDQVVRQLREYLFMVGAMPRPARAIPATPVLLIDHPWRRNPNKMQPRLVSKAEPGADLLRAREHKARVAADDNDELQQFMEREEVQLETTQAKACKELMEKLNIIAKEVKSGNIDRMKELHGISSR